VVLTGQLVPVVSDLMAMPAVGILPLPPGQYTGVGDERVCSPVAGDRPGGRVQTGSGRSRRKVSCPGHGRATPARPPSAPVRSPAPTRGSGAGARAHEVQQSEQEEVQT
jgi:hypothetical protein